MLFSLPKTLEVLEQTPRTLHSLLSNLSNDWVSANEGPETWSPFDVVGHLLHGDKSEWLSRAAIILSDSGDKHFKPFDRFAQLETSKGKTLNELLEEFSMVRSRNTELLREWNLGPAELSKTGIHPKFGEVTLAQLLATWTVHDLDHIAQISRVMARQYKEAVGPWSEFLRVVREG
ncbi:MAG: DinB family protein [Ferruginibacter sp.]